ncbi:MAG: hypothetical protein M1818_001347 [Claussenomyces sp. TS43310]|nr:MAG: hypothetical protein M1818_001347 [Claussenomyces sp. TS43310]
MRAPLKGAADNSRSGSNAAMAYDKHGTARPAMPMLSAAAAKASNKPPLTPRVVGSHAAFATTTPVARRAARPESTPTSGHAEDISTPVASFLANNITPRSSSRKSRVDSPSSTPLGTPAPEHAWLSSGPEAGLDAATNRPAPYSPAASESGNRRSQGQAANDDKFFYASEAKSLPPSQPRLGLQNKGQSKGSNFFYANGEAIPPPIRSGASVVGSVTGEERNQPKFFHANGTPDLAAPVPHHLPKSATTIPTTTPHSASPRLAQATAGSHSPQQRPASPQRMYDIANHSTTQTTPALSSSLPRPSIGRGQSAPPSKHTRRVSIEVPPRLSHSKAATLSGLDLTPLPRRISITTPLATPPPTADVQDEDRQSRGTSAVDESSLSDLHSPIKAGHSLEHMNELAANARRERKVLDLEIRNSSLEAINRTLERQMRKQSAELRRYRRLSRSGRLSIATAPSARTSIGTLSIIGEDGVASSDMSDDSDLDEEMDEEDDDSDLDDGTLSPGAMAANDLRHRRKDEKRLQLDLSKHQQLLVDSQKMNQSLKRCLGWSEEMIGEGKKALAYSVRVSDVELGGRVLVPEELGVDEDEMNLPDMSQLDDFVVNDAFELWAPEGKDDRDSGIELDALLGLGIESPLGDVT